MSFLGRTGKAALVYVVLAGMQRGMPLILLPFISQVMPPAEYGAASVLTASSLLVVTIAAAPLEALVVRAAARADDDSPALLRTMGIYCYFAMPVLLAMAAALFALLNPQFLSVSGHIWAIELLAIGFQPAMSYFALPVAQARQHLRLFTWLALTSTLLMATSKILLVIVWKLGVLGWVLSDLFSAAISALVAVALVRPPHVSVSRQHVRSVIDFALPLIPHRASFWAITSLSRPVMAVVSSFTQVGLLSLGLNIAAVAQLFLMEVNRAVTPRYSVERFPAPTQMTRAIVGIQLVIAFVAPAAVGSSLALIGQRLFAESYLPAFALTGILLIGQTAMGLYVIPTNYLVQAAGTTRPAAFASGAGGILIFVSLLAFGGNYGALGAAYATVGGFVLMAIIAAIMPKILGLDIDWRVWAPCWPELTMGAGALAGSVTALGFPVGSRIAQLIAAASLATAAIALLVSFNRWRTA